jgi:short-subunit dehydrogenase
MRLAWFNLVVAADEPRIHAAAEEFRTLGVKADALQVDLATLEGVDNLCVALENRSLDAVLANAGRGLGRAFLDQDFDAVRRVVDTNTTGTIYLLQKLAGACERTAKVAF